MDVNESCTLCNKPNDQMLMLACVHDPCINCAASAYAQQIHIKGQNREVYICQVCGEETVLDTSTITELTALANAVVKLPSRVSPSGKTLGNAGTSTHHAPATSATKRKQTQYPLAAVQPTSNKKVVYYCKEHGEQQISYYCFTCWSNICPECAIHGAHKDHQVKLIKKAISDVKAQYGEVIGKVADAQTLMNKLKDSFLRMIKETNDRHNRQKNMISREFQTMRNAITAKQKQLIKQLDEVNKQNIAVLTIFLQTINTNFEQANKIKRSVEHITKKDQVLILQDYKKISDLDEAVHQLNKTTEGISGNGHTLSTENLQAEIKDVIQSIQRIRLSLKKEETGTNILIGIKSANT